MGLGSHTSAVRFMNISGVIKSRGYSLRYMAGGADYMSRRVESDKNPDAADGQCRRFGLSLAAILILAFQGELIAFWFQRYLVSEEGVIPWAFHGVWEIAAFAFCAWFVSAIAWSLWGGERASLGMSIFGTVQIAALGACAVGVVGLIVPVDWRWPAPAYSGIVTYYPNDGGMVHIGQGVERRARARGRPTFLYQRDSPELQAALTEARNQSQYASVTVTQFVFWRTGLAAGFRPIGFDPRVQTFAPSRRPDDRIILFLTVGPAVVIECFLRATCFSGPVLLFLAAPWRMAKAWQLKRI